MSILNEYRKNLEQLIDETLLLCGDPLGEKWSPTRAAIAVNESVLDFVIKTQMVKEEINIQVKDDLFIYDVKTRIEDDGTLRLFAYQIRVGFAGKTEPAYMPVSLFDIDMTGYGSRVWYIDHLSPGKISIPIPSADGAALGASDPYEDNIQVLYVAMPTYMDDDADYPDSKILPIYHQAFPYGAASRLLDEGDEAAIARAVNCEAEFVTWIGRAAIEEHRGTTDYGGFRPG